MNPGRRLFLRDLGALAALAVAPISLQPLAPDEHTRLMAMLESGLVENHTFVLHSPIKVDMDLNLVIRNCVFRAAPDFPSGEPIITVNGSESLHIRDCHFYGFGLIPRQPGALESVTQDN